MCLHSEPSKVPYSTNEKLVEHFFGKHKNIFKHKYQAYTQNCHLTFNKNSVSSPHQVPNIKRQMTNDSVALILWVKLGRDTKNRPWASWQAIQCHILCVIYIRTFLKVLKVRRPKRSVNLETRLSSHNFSQKTNVGFLCTSKFTTSRLIQKESLSSFLQEDRLSYVLTLK